MVSNSKKRSAARPHTIARNVPDDLLDAASRIYLRSPVIKVDEAHTESPTPRSANCTKCNDWGGLHLQRKGYKTRKDESITEYLSWVRVKCDVCKWPKHRARAWAPRAACETVQVELKNPRECDTCGEEKEEANFPVLITLTCAHQPSACLTCLRGWITTQLDSGTCTIKCPDVDCPENLEPEDIQRQASSTAYQRFAHVPEDILRSANQIRQLPGIMP